jgi:hypothetical protein
MNYNLRKQNYDEIAFDVFFKAVVSRILASEQYEKTVAGPLYKLVARSSYGIRREYFEIVSLVETNYPDNKIGLPGRHKKAAAFMMAFMKKLSRETDKALCEEYRENLAIQAGLAALGTIIQAGGSRGQDDAGIISQMRENDGFILPFAPGIRAPYEKAWETELRITYNEGRLHVIQLAKELFCIEAYNRTLAKK